MFCANLIMPNGYRNSYSVSARNKTEARKRGSALPNYTAKITAQKAQAFTLSRKGALFGLTRPNMQNNLLQDAGICAFFVVLLLWLLVF
jgi:hypothetical protein